MTAQELLQTSMVELRDSPDLRGVLILEASVPDMMVLASLLTIAYEHPRITVRGRYLAKSVVSHIAEKIANDGLANSAAVVRLVLAEAVNRAAEGQAEPRKEKRGQ